MQAMTRLGNGSTRDVAGGATGKGDTPVDKKGRSKSHCTPGAGSHELRAFDKARRLVSKRKRRFQEDGFDLDLAYITPRIVAMGFPCTGLEAVYRNPRNEVQRFFDQRHRGHYKVYNLCCERVYDVQGIFPSVEHFPFKDHNPCPMDMLLRLLDSVAAYLAENNENVVAIHCKAGKGRTGMVVSCLLMHLGLISTAAEALAMFGERRTFDGEGVTIPSQIRYVQYVGRLLKRTRGFASPRRMALPRTVFVLRGVRLATVPGFSWMPGSHTCTPYFKVFKVRPTGKPDRSWEEVKVYSSRQQSKDDARELRSFEQGERYVYLNCSDKSVQISGDVLIKFYASQHLAKGKKMCHIWFHTSFVRSGPRLLQFDRDRIDGASKDSSCRNFSADFAIQLHLRSVEPARKEGSADDAVSEDNLVYEPSRQDTGHFWTSCLFPPTCHIEAAPCRGDCDEDSEGSQGEQDVLNGSTTEDLRRRAPEQQPPPQLARAPAASFHGSSSNGDVKGMPRVGSSTNNCQVGLRPHFATEPLVAGAGFGEASLEPACSLPSCSSSSAGSGAEDVDSSDSER